MHLEALTSCENSIIFEIRNSRQVYSASAQQKNSEDTETYVNLVLVWRLFLSSLEKVFSTLLKQRSSFEMNLRLICPSAEKVQNHLSFFAPAGRTCGEKISKGNVAFTSRHFMQRENWLISRCGKGY